MWKKEWFTLPLEEGKTPFRLHSTPYIFRREFPSFENFDLILSSSLCYSHFFKNKKFYSYELSFYEKLEKHELIKEFFIKDIEYKNPVIKIYNGRNKKRRHLKIMIPNVPYSEKLKREFEMVDKFPYGKETKSFFLQEGEEIERIFISRKPIKKFYIFFLSNDSNGFIKINNFLKSKKVKVEKGKDSFYILKPSLSFPFTKYRYSIRIKALGGLKKTFVRIIYDDIEAGLQFLQLGNYKEALECWRNAENKKHYPEISLYLGEINDLIKSLDGREIKSLKKIYNEKDLVEWKRAFRKVTGLDIDFLEESKTIKIQAEDGFWERGYLIESQALSNGRGIFLKEKEIIEISFSDIFLYPGFYKINPNFFILNKTEDMKMTITLIKDGEREDLEIKNSELKLSGKNAEVEIKTEIKKACSMKINFKIENGCNSIIDFIRITPSFHDFFINEDLIFQNYLKKLNQ